LAFGRQSALGPYIVDFECRRARLCVEVDGAQHAMTEAVAYDAQRTAWLESQGYRVLRYANFDVLRVTGAIVDEITSIAKQRVEERINS
jgi:very-short-patch-repair endonuclease